MHLNINKNNQIVEGNDIKFKRSVLINKLQKALTIDGYEIISSNSKTNPIYMTIKSIDNYELNLCFYLKNIHHSGWKTKKNYKRIQVDNFKEQHKDFNEHDNLLLYFGYYEYDDNPLFVAWFPYNYLNHNTIRSCYITLDIMSIAYKLGYYEGVVSQQKVWMFTPGNFNVFLKEYIKYKEEFHE